MTPSEKPASRDRFWLIIIGLLSLAVVGAVAFLILGPRPAGVAGRVDVSGMPLLNATLNGITAVLLVVAYVLIRRKQIARHRRVMLAAFFTSSMFLVSYVMYHFFKPAPQHYAGAYPALYFLILITHIVLAALIVPFALVTLYRGWFMNVPKHRWIARITLPLWLYVSVTGVVIYLMLY
jgi:putative membrane protein